MLIALIVSPEGAANCQPAVAPAGTSVLSRRMSAAARPEVFELPPVTSSLPQFALVSRYVGLLLNGCQELLTGGAGAAQVLTW